MTTNNEPARAPIPIESAMAGILALMVDEREARIANDRNALRTEVLLAAAGLSLDQIVALTGRTYNTVQKAVKRGVSKSAKGG